MNRSSIVVGLLATAAATSLGCKSSPKLAWWKSTKAEESTALAHAAPDLPSDIAKKAEAPPSSARIAGGDAAPFVPGGANSFSSTSVASTGANGYPSTDAPAFNASAAGQAVAGMAMPYDPSATPAPKANAASMVASTSSRYGVSPSTPAYGQPPASVAAMNSDVPAAYSMPVDSLKAASPAPGGSMMGSVAASGDNRYSMPSGGVAENVSPASMEAAPMVQNYGTAPEATKVAAATQPYRPGGTSSYTSVQVASRPSSATSTPGFTASPAHETTMPSSDASATEGTSPTSRY